MPAPASGSATDAARNQLFADLSKGEDVTKGLRKVTDDMKTHKNPALRFGSPQPFKPTTAPKPGSAGAASKTSHPVAAPAAAKAAAATKPPKCELEGGKKWIIEYQHGNRNVVINDTEMRQTVYIYKCDNSTIQIKGKVNAITMDGCKKTGLVFEEAISSLDFVNCQSVQAQVLVKVPTVSIDKTDGCMVYLSMTHLILR
jgi:adenylyl cyclase-associated protein